MQSANPSVSIKNADSRIYANSAKSHIQPQSAKDRESLQNVVGHSRETNKQKTENSTNYTTIYTYLSVLSH